MGWVWGGKEGGYLQNGRGLMYCMQYDMTLLFTCLFLYIYKKLSVFFGWGWGCLFYLSCTQLMEGLVRLPPPAPYIIGGLGVPSPSNSLHTHNSNPFLRVWFYDVETIAPDRED